MNDVTEKVCVLSHDACHEQLARLRLLLKEAAERLDDQAEAYYYLCETTQNAPGPARKGLENLIGGAGAAYAESWRELVAVARRAGEILDQIEKTAEVERQLRELEEAPE